MQAIILAAGMGMRLGALTDDRPKALVQVAGRELILRVMDFLDHPEITERIVVTGYEGECLEKFLKLHRPDVITARNPHYQDGSILSIETALPYIHGNFLLMNADHIYPRGMMQKIVSEQAGLTAICDFDRTLGVDDMKVKLSDTKKLLRIKKTLEDFDCGYIGMTYCDAGSLANYKGSIASTRKILGDTSNVEAALGRLAEEGHGANICDTTGHKWLEVDTPEDLKFAENFIDENPGFLK